MAKLEEILIFGKGISSTSALCLAPNQSGQVGGNNTPRMPILLINKLRIRELDARTPSQPCGLSTGNAAGKLRTGILGGGRAYCKPTISRTPTLRLHESGHHRAESAKPLPDSPDHPIVPVVESGEWLLIEWRLGSLTESAVGAPNGQYKAVGSHWRHPRYRFFAGRQTRPEAAFFSGLALSVDTNRSTTVPFLPASRTALPLDNAS